MSRPAGTPWTSRAGWAALVAVVVGSWALRFAGQGTRIPLDTMIYFWPLYEATYARVADGVAPLWNPYQLAGIPWLATLQGGVFYPGHVLYVVLPLHLAFMASNVLHLLLIAIATAVFVRRLGLGAAPALLAAVVVTLRGNVPTLQFAPNHLEAYAWLPVGAVACLELVRRPGRRAVALLATSMALSLLAGYPQPTVYVAYTWATLVVALVIEGRPDRRRLGRVVLGFAAGVVLGALLAGVQMLPAAELMRHAVRAPQELAERAMFPVSSVLTPALIPLRFGAIAGMPFSFGVGVLALVPVALAARRRRAIACWAVAVAVVTALFALGDLTPALSVYKALPALGWFRNPSRILTVTEFGVAIAVAFGLDAIVGTSLRAPTRTARAIAGLATGGVVWLASAGWAPADAWTRVIGCAGVIVAGLAIASASPRSARAVATAMVVGVVLVETSTTPWIDLRLPYAASDVQLLRAFDGPLRALAASAGHDRVWRYGSVMTFQPEQAFKLATLYRIRGIDDYEPLNLARQASFFTYFTEGSTAQERPPWLFAGSISTLESPPGVPPPARRRRLLDLLATRFLVVAPGLRYGDRALATFIEEAGFVDANIAEGWKVFENPGTLPRAFVTYRALRAPARPDDLLRELSRPEFDPLAESYVEGDLPSLAPDAPRGHPITFVRDEESEVELEATLERPGLVVLADSFYPGWHATVDGRQAPILATNHLFRGVPVDAGTHRVRFVYAPASVRLGAACTVFGLVMLVCLLRKRPHAVRRDRVDIPS